MNIEKRKIKVWININNKQTVSQKFQQLSMMRSVKFKILKELLRSNQKSKYFRGQYQKIKRNQLNLSLPKSNL